MHETRNFIMVLLLAAAVAWAFVAWLILGEGAPALLFQRVFATGLVVSLGAWLLYSLKFEDKLPDHLAATVGELYYEVDGLSFMPIVRMNNGEAELCVYYQNRFEEPVQAIVHLRPPEDSFIIRPGLQDVHFAFKANGGDFGVIHQPISVPAHLQGEVINVQLAAASWYPRSHGTRLRRKPGMPCGSLIVDWGGSAFKAGVHEVSGEIELTRPATLHLSMPKNAPANEGSAGTWRQEQLHAGAAA